jgi:predicted AAA+ superfamily ATPase
VYNIFRGDLKVVENYIHRHIENAIKNDRFSNCVIAVTGARQTGKSTMLETLLSDIPNVTFDDLRIRTQAKTDPALFIEENEAPIFIDEIQRAPEILSFVKVKVDKAKQNSMYYVSGSQKFNMMKDMSESLAGRVSIFELLGLSMREITGDNFDMPFMPTNDYLKQRKKPSKLDVWELIHKGSMPKMHALDLDWKKFYQDYIDTYLSRDVNQLAQVGDNLKFTQFMQVLAARTSNMLNLNDVCKEIGISHPTAENWTSILEKSNIIYLLRPYHNNLTNRAVKTPKLYFLDTGLAAYLAHWDTKEVLKAGAKNGDFFENFIVCEILKSYYNAGYEPNNIYYYRDKDGNEIDLVFETGGVLYPVEIKMHSNPTASDIKAFNILHKLTNVGEGGVICQCDRVMSIIEGMRSIPLEFI